MNIYIEKYIDEEDFPVVSIRRSASVINFDKSDYQGVIRATNDLQNDIDSVTGKRSRRWDTRLSTMKITSSILKVQPGLSR